MSTRGPSSFSFADIARRLERLDSVVRWRYLILSVAAALFAAQIYRHGSHDWHFLVDGSKLLFGDHSGFGWRSPLFLKPGGLKLYASYPGLQIGPLSFLAALPFRALGPADRFGAVVVMTAAAPALIYLLERTARHVRPVLDPATERLFAWTVLVGGILVVQTWSSVAVQYAHLDDVLVLVFACVVLHAVVRGDATVAGIALGLAIAAKPWGIIALPFVWVLPRERRWRMLWLSAFLAAAAWLPFVLADPDTLRAIRPHLATSTSSILHLFGVGVEDQPAWVRPLQLAGALTAGSVAVWRGRWGAVLAVGIGVRLALDPGVFLYYSSGMLLAALAWDLTRSRWAVPVWSFVSFWFIAVVREGVMDETVQAVFRLALIVALLVVVFLAPGRDEPVPLPERDEARVRRPGLRQTLGRWPN